MVGLAAASTYNYDNNGADWPDLDIANNECGGTNQSPINLVYGNANANLAKKEYKGKLIGWKDDDPQRDYDNGFNLTPVWDGFTVTTDLETDADAEIGFRSQVAADIFETSTDWRASSFHFKSGSEHTIDG